MDIFNNVVVNFSNNPNIVSYLFGVLMFSVVLMFFLFFVVDYMYSKRGKKCDWSIPKFFIVSFLIVNSIIFSIYSLPPSPSNQEIFFIKNTLASKVVNPSSENDWITYKSGSNLSVNPRKGKMLLWDLTTNNEFSGWGEHVSADIIVQSKEDYSNPHTLYLIETKKTNIGKYSTSQAPAYSYQISVYTFYMPEAKYVGKMSYTYKDPTKSQVGVEWISDREYQSLFQWLNS